MMENSLTKKFSLLTEKEQIELREEIRSQIERNLLLWTRFLVVLDNNKDSEQVIRTYLELERLEEAEIFQGYLVATNGVKDPFKDLEKAIEDGKERDFDLKSRLEEVVEITGILEKPTKRIKIRT
jgi:hypothetical protein